VRSAYLEEWEREKALSAAVFQPGLTEDDRAWIRDHLELAGARIPTVDISWITLTDGS
jgi:hypothetical protein